MAGHAGLGRRHAGEGRRLDRGVAIAAVDADVADVVLVAERHRLLDRRAEAGCGAMLIRQAKHSGGEQQQDGEGAELEREDEPRLEDLCHASFSL